MQKLAVNLGGHTAPRDLVDQILGFARARGMDQRALAERAGISPETLSRIKQHGGCRLSTALALAHAAGLRRIALDQRGRAPTGPSNAPPRGVAASIAARKLSAGRRQPITPSALVRALTRGAVTPENHPHLLGFFEELPVESVHDVVLDHALDFGQLLALARTLGAEGEVVAWIEEMAGHSVA